MTVLAVAHRAGNSLVQLRAAEALGADVVECDVHHRRGALEATHLKGVGPLPVLWDRWELVSTRVPRLGLEELLAARAEGTTLMLDLKGRHRATARAVADLLQRREDREGQQRQGPVLVCGRWWPTVEAVASVPSVRPVLSARTARELARLRRRLEAGPPVHGVSVHRSLLDEPTVAALHRHVDLVMTWPVNDVAVLDAMLACGVSGIISDEPAVLAELLARRER